MSYQLTAKPGRGEKIHLSVNGKYIATTDRTTWYSFGYPDKTELDLETLQNLLDRVAQQRMYDKALDLLSQREYTRKELTDKLVRKSVQERKNRARREKRKQSENAELPYEDDSRNFGVTDASFSTIELDAQQADYTELRQRAEAICDHLEEVGLLSDERFARIYAEEQLRNKHLSANGLRVALRQKGVSRELSDLIVEELEPDPEESIRALLQTKFRTRNLEEERDRRRTVNALLRLGYSYSDINQVIQETRSSNE